jgi:SET domain-containing protein
MLNAYLRRWNSFENQQLQGMALLEKQLVVKKSTIPNSGKGLFTKKLIPKGTRIVEYKGKITSWKDADHRNGENGYIYYVKRYHVIDALPYPKGLARFANDARGIERVKGITNNSEYVEDGLKVYIQSKKQIPANTEILVGYGKEYWDVIKDNRKSKTYKKRRAGN